MLDFSWLKRPNDTSQYIHNILRSIVCTSPDSSFKYILYYCQLWPYKLLFIISKCIAYTRLRAVFDIHMSVSDRDKRFSDPHRVLKSVNCVFMSSQLEARSTKGRRRSPMLGVVPFFDTGAALSCWRAWDDALMRARLTLDRVCVYIVCSGSRAMDMRMKYAPRWKRKRDNFNYKITVCVIDNSGTQILNSQKLGALTAYYWG